MFGLYDKDKKSFGVTATIRNTHINYKIEDDKINIRMFGLPMEFEFTERFGDLIEFDSKEKESNSKEKEE